MNKKPSLRQTLEYRLKKEADLDYVGTQKRKYDPPLIRRGDSMQICALSRIWVCPRHPPLDYEALEGILDAPPIIGAAFETLSFRAEVPGVIHAGSWEFHTRKKRRDGHACVDEFVQIMLFPTRESAVFALRHDEETFVDRADDFLPARHVRSAVVDLREFRERQRG